MAIESIQMLTDRSLCSFNVGGYTEMIDHLGVLSPPSEFQFSLTSYRDTILHPTFFSNRRTSTRKTSRGKTIKCFIDFHTQAGLLHQEAFID
jgi:hypothetical protein